MSKNDINDKIDKNYCSPIFIIFVIFLIFVIYTTVSLLRPLALLLDNTLRPVLVCILFKNPCLRFLLFTLG